LVLGTQSSINVTGVAAAGATAEVQPASRDARMSDVVMRIQDLPLWDQSSSDQ
jgi:hypothetical protein